MKKVEDVRAERLRALAGKEVELWAALIGANGSPHIQKFIIISRLYSFARTLVNIEDFDQMSEEVKMHRFVRNAQNKKLKQFINFIDGTISIEQAEKHQAEALKAFTV